VPEPWIAEESVPCLDPECPGRMEPEEDGDQHYWACTTCGYEGGYAKAQTSTTMCAAGVMPEPPAPQPLISLGMPGRRTRD
jgi:hypothetical protein